MMEFNFQDDVFVIRGEDGLFLSITREEPHDFLLVSDCDEHFKLERTWLRFLEEYERDIRPFEEIADQLRPAMQEFMLALRQVREEVFARLMDFDAVRH